MKKLIALDLDGTLTQHRTPMEPANRAALTALAGKYRLLMVGAGECMRIFRQMEHFPIDIIGNYGMQEGVYDAASDELRLTRNDSVPCDTPEVERRVTALREQFGFTTFTGNNVQYYPSGCVTIPLLGTAAKIEDKLAFDPTREKRRVAYPTVVSLFPEYNVFVGGSSSFDMAPKPYDKRNALIRYCAEQGIDPADALFVGDDYGQGGNDEAVYRSEIDFLTIDDYRTFPQVIRSAGLLG